MSARMCPVVTVERWANGSAIDPDERIRKDQLKAILSAPEKSLPANQRRYTRASDVEDLHCVPSCTKAARSMREIKTTDGVPMRAVETVLHCREMSPEELTAFRIAPEIMAGLRAIKERDGVPISVQVDRALRVWLVDRKVLQVAKKRPSQRRRSERGRKGVV